MEKGEEEEKSGLRVGIEAAMMTKYISRLREGGSESVSSSLGKGEGMRYEENVQAPDEEKTCVV